MTGETDLIEQRGFAFFVQKGPFAERQGSPAAERQKSPAAERQESPAAERQKNKIFFLERKKQRTFTCLRIVK